MSILSLVLVNLGRNKRRTILTTLSVMVGVFLFCALGGVLDTMNRSIQLGSLTRLVTRNKISLVFPMPYSYRDRLAAVPGIRRVGIQNWFGGVDPKDPHNFFAQFAVDDNFLAIYRPDVDLVEYSTPQVETGVPEGNDPRLASFFQEQTACIVGKQLMVKNGWKLGQTITVSGTIYPGDWPMTIRAVYVAKRKNFGEQTVFFHFKYLDEKGMGGSKSIGIYVLDLANPDQAATIAKTVDAMFVNSSAATLTESEQAFQAGFISMYGNVPFVLRVIGLAIVFAILLVAANTMMTTFRERTSEFGVLKTLGFADSTVFGIVLAEAALITLGGGIAGALLAKLLIEGSGFSMNGFLPPMSVYWSTVLVGVGIAVLMGAVSGLIPAWRAANLRIVDALRRVD
ncbi:MAG TPA: FtsX-like permease family protein [Candidatus Sulfotelmatobacter sp.]|nr:FtsX-like permease family protein [Candidatus Sulfotelmatobacter sp.]